MQKADFNHVRATLNVISPQNQDLIRPNSILKILGKAKWF